MWLLTQEHSKYFPQFVSIIIKHDYPWINTEHIHSFHHPDSGIYLIEALLKQNSFLPAETAAEY